MDIREVLELAWLIENSPPPQDPDARKLEVMRQQKKAADLRLRRERARQKIEKGREALAKANQQSP